jgi:hypothetical protein
MNRDDDTETKSSSRLAGDTPHSRDQIRKGFEGVEAR